MNALRAWRSAAWTAALFVLAISVMPVSVPPIAGDLTDKLGHALTYALTAAIFLRAYPAPPALAVAGGLAAYGGAIELVQHAIPYRFGSFADAVANAVGISIMLAIHSAGRQPG